jgi:hypothetical protein
VPDAKTGDSVPLLSVSPDNVASLEPALVTAIVYVFVVVPSCAVTTTVMVLLPTLRLILPDAVPLDTAVPFTVTAAFDSFTVGVTVIEVTAYATLAV